MDKNVFIVIFKFFDEELWENVEHMVGIFSSKDLAESAIQTCVTDYVIPDDPKFKFNPSDYPEYSRDSYSIKEIEIDKVTLYRDR